MRLVRATRYVTPLREGGSLPAIVEADDGGLYVTKFRGAGQGARALVAEWIAGELGRAAGLRVPDIVGVELPVELARNESHDEVRDLLMASLELDEARLVALFPGSDVETIRGHLAAFERICRGEGPIGALTQSERFHWLVAPRSTVVQVGPVHSGVCADPPAQLERLFKQLVARQGER